jgi:hypothetical protein
LPSPVRHTASMASSSWYVSLSIYEVFVKITNIS